MSDQLEVSFTIDDMLSDYIELPDYPQGSAYWGVEPSGDHWIRTERHVSHARGERCVATLVPMDALLDSLAATKAGRRVMLEALMRHES